MTRERYRELILSTGFVKGDFAALAGFEPRPWVMVIAVHLALQDRRMYG